MIASLIGSTGALTASARTRGAISARRVLRSLVSANLWTFKAVDSPSTMSARGGPKSRTSAFSAGIGFSCLYWVHLQCPKARGWKGNGAADIFNKFKATPPSVSIDFIFRLISGAAPNKISLHLARLRVNQNVV
jgi:hypothetical protein